jgi:hypothetical protein
MYLVWAYLLVTVYQKKTNEEERKNKFDYISFQPALPGIDWKNSGVSIQNSYIWVFEITLL